MTSCKSSDMRHIRRNIKKKGPRMKNRIKNNRKKRHQHNLKQFVVLMSYKNKFTNRAWTIKQIDKYLQTNSRGNIVKIYTSEYRWTFLFRRWTQATIPTMLLQRSRYLYPKRNCSQRFWKIDQNYRNISKPNKAGVILKSYI